ncbi:hypothetical protein DHC50_10675 [Arenibacter sp. A80]|nr:hypothetical protein [Arenibacter sp. A80]RFT56755.1 hypothetical protein D0S24_10665 [Arenibacter sp. P308M17]
MFLVQVKNTHISETMEPRTMVVFAQRILLIYKGINFFIGQLPEWVQSAEESLINSMKAYGFYQK